MNNESTTSDLRDWTEFSDPKQFSAQLMPNPKVSICMPTYNNESFVAEALDSCLAQTYKNIEICVSDDKSSDRTAEIVKMYVDAHPEKIKYRQMPSNMGIHSIAFNVNNALDMCTGKYIAILEGDDVMLPTRIEEQVAILENNPLIIAVHHDITIYDDLAKAETKKKWGLKDYGITPEELILYCNYVFTPTLMFRNIGVRTDAAIKRMLDWHLLIQLSVVGEFHYQDKKLTRYRMHANNITKKGFDDDISVVLALVEKQYPALIRHVNIRRTMNYMQKLRAKKWNYIVPVLSMGLINIAMAVVTKINFSRKIAKYST